MLPVSGQYGVVWCSTWSFSGPVLMHQPSCVPICAQASCVQYRLIIRDVNTLQIVQLYTCLDQIQYIEWSSDSLFILCAMYKRGIVQVRTQAESFRRLVCAVSVNSSH